MKTAERSMLEVVALFLNILCLESARQLAAASSSPRSAAELLEPFGSRHPPQSRAAAARRNKRNKHRVELAAGLQSDASRSRKPGRSKLLQRTTCIMASCPFEVLIQDGKPERAKARQGERGARHAGRCRLPKPDNGMPERMNHGHRRDQDGHGCVTPMTGPARPYPSAARSATPTADPIWL